MVEEQMALFTEDELRQRIEKLEGKIRYRADEVRSILKQTMAYMSLLKDSPKTVTDIYFRCQTPKLAKETLELLKQQSLELGDLFEEARSAMATLEEWDEDLRELKAKAKDFHKEPTEAELENGPDYVAGEDDLSPEDEADELLTQVETGAAADNQI